MSNHGKKIGLTIGILLLGGLFALIRANNNTKKIVNNGDSNMIQPPEISADLLITDNDNLYNYKYTAGHWYTQLKTNTATWYDMQTTPGIDYTKAMQVLKNYCDQHGITFPQ